MARRPVAGRGRGRSHPAADPRAARRRRRHLGRRAGRAERGGALRRARCRSPRPWWARGCCPPPASTCRWARSRWRPLSNTIGSRCAATAARWTLSGTAARVPWGRNAKHVVVLAESGGKPMVARVAGGAAKVEPDTNLAMEPRDTLTWSNAAVAAAGASDGPAARLPVAGRRHGPLGADGGRARVPALPVGEVRERAEAVRQAALRRSR